MARRPAAPKSVNALKHKARRKNIPTQENAAFLQDEETAPVRVELPRHYSPATHPELYKRNEDLDPQLVWRGNSEGDGEVQLVWKGKDDEDQNPLSVDAVPIYIQEKIHPKAIIDDIRRRQEEGAEDWRYDSDAPDLFADFNGIPDEEDKISYYEHDRVGLKWTNRMILGDSLQVMASLAEKEGLRGKVQMIYLDPPYGIKFNSNWQVSTFETRVEDGKVAHFSREPEQVKAFRDTWSRGIHSYLSYLRDRVACTRELLSDSGSLFLQIGDQNIHLVRSVAEEVFGAENFVTSIAFRTTSTLTSATLSRSVDHVLWFARSVDNIKYRQLYWPKTRADDKGDRFTRLEEQGGLRRFMTRTEREADSALSAGTRVYRHDNVFSQDRASEPQPFVFQGHSFDPWSKGSHWKCRHPEGVERLAKADRLALPTPNSISYVRYLDDFGVQGMANVWLDTQTGAFTDDKIYVVQTNTKVIERCLLMTTEPGDLVLDPTCGSGTAATVAEQWGRRWITIDTSRVALALARARLMGARYDHYHLKDSPEGAIAEAEKALGRKLSDAEKSDALASGPFSGDISHGFVYDRAPHITLKSIANNAEIDVIWEKHQPKLEDLRAALNAAAKTDWEEWQVPHPPVYPWGDKAQKLHAKAKDLVAERAELEADEDTSDEALNKHDKKIVRALKALNTELKRDYTRDTLPEHAGDPLPEAAVPIHADWWEARRARQKEIDASIAAKADVELLYDRPVAAKNVVRVAGPFTVESLSPHRVLDTEDDDPWLLETLSAEDSGDDHRITATRFGERPDPEPDRAATQSDSFIRVVLDNLEKAGVGNTKKQERLRFLPGSIRPFAGRYINAEGRYAEGDTEGAPERKAAIFIGPEYGTVSRQMLMMAARSARENGFDIVIACGFAFEAHATPETLDLGGMTILKVNMNQDLRMGDRLKSADQGNLFVVFGEPDVDFRKRKSDGLYEVEILGVDIFNPNTGEQRSSSKVEDDVACWFLDSVYDHQSFFVRHAYFLGGKDPYEKLQKALKAEINEEAWETLYSAVSHPFKEPASGKIAVKVINHYGDEVLKVYDVRDAREV